MAGRRVICRRETTHFVVLCCLLASSWCVVSAADLQAVAKVPGWGVQDQTAVVGRLFELRLPTVKDNTVLTVSYTHSLSLSLSLSTF